MIAQIYHVVKKFDKTQEMCKVSELSGKKGMHRIFLKAAMYPCRLFLQLASGNAVFLSAKGNGYRRL